MNTIRSSVFGQLVDAVEAALAHQRASSAASSRSASCAVTLFWWCHFMLFSANAMPLPLTVWQMTAVGFAGSSGSSRQHVAQRARRRGRRLRRTAKPNARHLSANGSRFCTSAVLPYDWCLL